MAFFFFSLNSKIRLVSVTSVCDGEWEDMICPCLKKHGDEMTLAIYVLFTDKSHLPLFIPLQNHPDFSEFW